MKLQGALLVLLVLTAPFAHARNGGDGDSGGGGQQQGMAPGAECSEAFDEYLQDNYSNFFTLLRLLNYYTMDDPTPPGPPLDLSVTNGMPVTVLVPTDKAVNNFLKDADLDLKKLAQSPRRVVELAPSVANHFLIGAFPASQIAFQPAPPQFESQQGGGGGNGGGRKMLQAPGQVTTVCGPTCPPLAFFQASNGSQLVAAGNAAVEITKPDEAMCSGQYIIHEVNGILFNNVTNAAQIAQPAIALARLTGGRFDSYNIAGAQPGLAQELSQALSGRGGGGQQGGGGGGGDGGDGRR